VRGNGRVEIGEVEAARTRAREENRRGHVSASIHGFLTSSSPPRGIKSESALTHRLRSC
jgi:hypothetical protein